MKYIWLRASSWSYSRIWREIKNERISYTLYLLVAVSIFLGGAPNKINPQFLIITLIAIVLLGFALYGEAWEKFRSLPGIIQVFGLITLLTPLLQLVPLPPFIWATFPGREIEYGVIAQLENPDSWRAISLDWDATLFGFFTLLTPISALLAALCLNSKQIHRAIITILIVSCIAFIVGAVQFLTAGRIFDFYHVAHHGSFLGFFANRNHTSLFFAIVLSCSFAIIFSRKLDKKMLLFCITCLVFVATVVALGASSRAGYLLLLISIGANLISRFGMGARPLRNGLISIGLLACFAAIANQASSVVQKSFARFEFLGDGDRLEKWYYTLVAAFDYFPFGSGMGTFVPVYAKFEQLDMVMPPYVNHAHNDYLELFLETGIIGIIVLGLFALGLAKLWFDRGAAVSKSSRELLFPLKVVLALVLLHSVVDYPLRTQAIAVLFAISLGLLWSRLYLSKDSST